jgi:Tfp pilus assembly protein PilF
MTEVGKVRPGIVLFAGAALALAGCTESVANKPDPLGQNVIDDAGLNELLLTAGDPEEAVTYFSTALAEEPERADLRRGLAVSLTRAKRPNDAARVYQEMVSLGQATPADRLDYGFVAVRLERWEDAKSLSDGLPEGLNTARRHLLTALIADHERRWEAADAAYERAEKLTTNPAEVLNNWGVSKLSRKEFAEAEELFQRAVSFDSGLFRAKNNLAIARGLQGNYQLPIVPLSDTEQAVVLNNLGLVALQNGETDVARGLFAAAVEAHPKYYEAAADRLAALEAKVEN